MILKIKRQLIIFLCILAPYNSFALISGQNNANTILQSLNQATLALSHDSEVVALKSFNPVIVAMQDRMTLYYNGKQQQVEINPEEYTQLKIYAHIELGIFSIGNFPEDPLLIAKLTSYRQKIVVAQNVIDSLPLTSEQKTRQRNIIQKSLAFIDSTITLGKIDPIAYDHYFKDINPLIWKNVNEATIAKLNLVDKTIQIWRQQISSADWQKLRVVVTGLHLLHTDNLLLQYFSQLIHTSETSGRLIFGENLFTNEAALNLLARASVDTEMGRIVFGDSKRMYRDLLGDATQQRLQQGFGGGLVKKQ